MILDLSIPLNIEKARTKLDYLIEKGVTVELTEKRKRRSISQNNYLHLVLSWFGLEAGYTLQEVKQQIFKERINSDVFYLGEQTKGGVTIQKWRSTSDLNTKELTDCIEKFRNWSSKEAGIYLPEPKDLAMLQEIENQIKNNRKYL